MCGSTLIVVHITVQCCRLRTCYYCTPLSQKGEPGPLHMDTQAYAHTGSHDSDYQRFTRTTRAAVLHLYLVVKARSAQPCAQLYTQHTHTHNSAQPSQSVLQGHEAVVSLHALDVHALDVWSNTKWCVYIPAACCICWLLLLAPPFLAAGARWAGAAPAFRPACISCRAPP